MTDSPPSLAVLPPVVAATLRGVRRLRRMTVSELAEGMGMPLRSYQHFEAGGGRLNIGQLIRFAELTNCDFFALLAAILLQTPNLAILAADSKVITALAISMADFCDAHPSDLAKLTPAAIRAAFTEALAAISDMP